MAAVKFSSILMLSFLTACTQGAAPIAYKGSDYYGRQAGGGTGLQIEPRYYPTNSPRIKDDYAVQAVPASTGSVGVSELPPPVQVKELAPATTAKPLPPRSALEVPKPTLQAAHEVETAMPVLPAEKATPPSPVINAKTASKTQTTALIWPAEGKVISRFGAKGEGRTNDGINIQAAEGEPIYAAANGKVIYVGNTVKGYGTMALVQHEGGRTTSYAHANDIVVKKGDAVTQGQVIGYVGRTGGVKTAQLHFSVREGTSPVDPLRFLPQEIAQAN